MTRLAELDVDDHDGVPVVRLRGELDLSNVGDVGDALAASLPHDAPGSVVDMTGVRHLDSAGVRMLFELRRLIGLRRQQLSLVVPAEARIREVVDLAAVGATVPIFETVEEAVSAVRAAQLGASGS